MRGHYPRGVRPLAAADILVPAAVALAGCGSSGHPAASPKSSGPASVVTVTAARQVLRQYTADKNKANQVRQASLLGAFEGGTSLGADAGAFKFEVVNDPANRGYAPLSYVSPAWYVPRQSTYPAWFAVRARQQQLATPKLAGTDNNAIVYLVFTRASASAAWKQVLEPNESLTGPAAPPVATGSGGYATQLSPAAADGLALAPGQIPADTVTYLDASEQPTTPARPGLPTPKPKAYIPVTGSQDGLLDLADKSFFRDQMPAGSTTLDTHATTGDQVFVLRTASGGALVFYDLSAGLTIGAPGAQLFSIKIDGFFNGQQARAFNVSYADQFAVYEAPGSPARLEGLANYSGRLSSECDGAPCS